jgi:predicted DNA-binding transcriptional regulator AlpA
MATTESPYMTTEELAALIRSNPVAIHSMRHRGTAPRGQRVGRRVLFHRDDVAAWMQARLDADPLAQRATA